MSFSVGTMGAEKNPLDLNNLPDDYTSRDRKHIFEEGSSSGYKKKKSGASDGKDESGKVYECRFCSLKFCKSQALGGHMNRHRQEREKEILNRARHLVLNNHNMGAQGHLGYVYPQRLFSVSSSTTMPLPIPLQSPPQPHLQPSQYFNVGYVVGSSSSSQYPQQNLINYPTAPHSNYTCIGAPVGHVLGHGAIRGADMGGSGGGGGGVSPNMINRFQDGF